ncbi:hypothetical protein [Hydrogenimonas sp. SS33]|uniref:hypothetical protein n=1 Tax=Hydrogenimonas leucolamina TaxID=2954236 RepID=UPI00336BEE4E
MKWLTKKWFVLITTAILIGTMSGCGNKRSEEAGSSNIATRSLQPSIYGIVYDENNSAVSGQTVEIAIDRDHDGFFERPEEIKFVSTNAKGLYRYLLDESESNETVPVRITVERAGYFKALRRFDFIKNIESMNIDVRLQKGVKANVNGRNIETIVAIGDGNETRKIEIILPLAYPKGTTAQVAYVNPNTNREAFPGNFVGSDTVGNGVVLKSLGVLRINVFDENGHVIHPEGNITIRMPFPKNLWKNVTDDLLATSDRIEVPLWWFDDETGRWEQSNQPALITDNTGAYIPSSKVYDIVNHPENINGPLWIVGSVPHLSSWNNDFEGTSNGVSGKIKNGKKGSVCDEAGNCVPVDKNGNFRHTSRQGKTGTKDILDAVKEMNKVLDELNEKMEKANASAGSCPPLQEAYGKVLQGIDKTVGSDVEAFIFTIKNDATRKNALELYKRYKKAAKAGDYRRAVKYIGLIQNLVPNSDVAKKYGGNSIAYYNEKVLGKAWDEVVNIGGAKLSEGLTDVIMNSKALAKLKPDAIKTCAKGVKDLVEGKIKGIVNDVNGEAINQINNLITTGHVEEAKKIVIKMLKKRYPVLVAPHDKKSYEQYIENVKSDISDMVGNENLMQCISEQMKVMGKTTFASFIKKITAMNEEFEEKAGTTLFLTQILASELDLAIEEKKAHTTMENISDWKRLDDDKYNWARIGIAIQKRIEQDEKEGKITQQCAEQYRSIMSGSLSHTSRNFTVRSLSIRQESFDDEMEQIEERLKDVKSSNPALYDIISLLLKDELTTLQYLHIRKMLAEVAGADTTYNKWIDGNGNESSAPPLKRGGGTRHKLYYMVDGKIFPLGVSDAGVDGDNVGYPRYGFYENDKADDKYYRQIGTFEPHVVERAMKIYFLNEKGEKVILENGHLNAQISKYPTVMIPALSDSHDGSYMMM